MLRPQRNQPQSLRAPGPCDALESPPARRAEPDRKIHRRHWIAPTPARNKKHSAKSTSRPIRQESLPIQPRQQATTFAPAKINRRQTMPPHQRLQTSRKNAANRNPQQSSRPETDEGAKLLMRPDQ